MAQTDATMLGGWSHPPQEADAYIQAICDKVEKKVATGINVEKFLMFHATLYISQVVSGMNYRIKVRISEESQIRIQVYQPLGETAPELTAVGQDGPLNNHPF
ncbi:stefin-C-like [Sycon ciliatum]|uniref:stefin-C-like n=1 Tax=Sycon ciliatum TaxID=27933 RepID=UPI0031F6BC17|eukprot:scpid94176/ scgid11198/ Stefin-C